MTEQNWTGLSSISRRRRTSNCGFWSLFHLHFIFTRKSLDMGNNMVFCFIRFNSLCVYFSFRILEGRSVFGTLDLAGNTWHRGNALKKFEATVPFFVRHRVFAPVLLLLLSHFIVTDSVRPHRRAITLKSLSRTSHIGNARELLGVQILRSTHSVTLYVNKSSR